jgi:fascin 1
LNADEIHVDEIIPWGSDAILTVEYVDGQYCIRSSNGLYFHRDGKLLVSKSNDTLFQIELYKGHVVFKDCRQCYLTAIGPLGIMTTRNKSPGKDEQFLLEESKQQICLVAPNGKLVSIKQGVDVSANQCERDDSSIFQLEYDDELDMYHLRTCTNKYWRLEGYGVQATADKK